MWHLTENMDEEATNANEIEFQDIKSKQLQFSSSKIQILKFQGVKSKQSQFSRGKIQTHSKFSGVVCNLVFLFR